MAPVNEFIYLYKGIENFVTVSNLYDTNCINISLVINVTICLWKEFLRKLDKKTYCGDVEILYSVIYIIRVYR